MLADYLTQQTKPSNWVVKNNPELFSVCEGGSAELLNTYSVSPAVFVYYEHNG